MEVIIVFAIAFAAGAYAESRLGAKAESEIKSVVSRLESAVSKLEAKVKAAV